MHSLVGEVVIEIDLDAVACRLAFLALIHSERRAGGQGGVEYEEGDERPNKHVIESDGHILRRFIDQRHDQLDPTDPEHAPEYRIEQANSAVDVERERAVIPSHGAEDDLLAEGAYVFGDGADDERSEEATLSGPYTSDFLLSM